MFLDQFFLKGLLTKNHGFKKKYIFFKGPSGQLSLIFKEYVLKHLQIDHWFFKTFCWRTLKSILSQRKGQYRGFLKNVFWRTFQPIIFVVLKNISEEPSAHNRRLFKDIFWRIFQQRTPKFLKDLQSNINRNIFKCPLKYLFKGLLEYFLKDLKNIFKASL